jgi:transposase InsO family protein
VGQREARGEDRQLRTGLLEYFWTMVKNGAKQVMAAEWMGFPLRTLQSWMGRDGSGDHALPPLGRPAKRGTAAQRNAVVATLNEYGPTLGVPSLHDRHPHMSLCELAEIKRRWVRIQVKRYKVPIRVLHWTRPGTVWAMDYTKPPGPVEAVFEQILVAQDLASSHPLESLCLPRKSGKMVRIALDRLFDKHGVPLVLKADNDSTFLAQEVVDLLEERGVLLLLSPPGTPWYNGAVELCNCVLKRFARSLARYHGRLECWSCDDVRNARDAIGDLRREAGLTRRETFESRTPVTDADREALRLSFEKHRPLALEELLRELETPPYDIRPKRMASLQAKADRIALERALCENGLLFFRSRRVSPLLSADFRARIS